MNKTFLWILRLIPVIILLQTLYFKFTGAPEAVFIFTQMGVEPWGRYVLGVLELITGILLLTPWFVSGALLGILLMLGALFAHLTTLGIEVQGDGGLLFGMALVVLITCGILLYTRRKNILFVNW